MHAALLALALAFAAAPPPAPAPAGPPAAKRPAQQAPKPLGVVIWGGGVAKADGDKALADAKAHLPADVALAAGYPKVVASKDVAGLKPGFHVAVLGVCEAGPGMRVVERLRAAKAGVYQRRVARHPSLVVACPTLRPAAPDGAAEDRGPTIALGTLDGAPVTATLVTTTEDTCADADEDDDGEPRACEVTETLEIVARIGGARRVLWSGTTKEASSDVECDKVEAWRGPTLRPPGPGEALARLAFRYEETDGCAGVYAPAPTADEVAAEVAEKSFELVYADGRYAR